jgi:hypothetical protein
MTERYRHPNIGIEFDFLVINSDRRVIFVSTAGYGPVTPEAMFDVDVDLVREIKEIKPLTQAERVLDGPGNYELWDEVARRGLFAVDWSTMSERYRLVSKPTDPVLIDDLPAGVVRDLARRARLSDVDLLSQKVFNPPWHGPT